MKGKSAIETPLIESQAMSRRLGAPVYLKLENLQPSGSFKLRGIGALIDRAHASRPELRTVYSSSGGNAGLAASWAARDLGLQPVVFVPESTPASTRQRLQMLGARVEVHGQAWDECDQACRAAVAMDPAGVYVPPFDHPDIWTGHSSIVDELVAHMPSSPSAVVCAVGGGGLFCGLHEGLSRSAWREETALVCVETEGASGLAQSLAKGVLYELPAITSVAKSLGARRIATAALEKAQGKSPEVHSVVLSDREACAAAARLADEHRFVVEAACGAALAAISRDRLPSSVLQRASKEHPIVVIVCGGCLASPMDLVDWMQLVG